MNESARNTSRKNLQKRIKELHTHSYLTLLSIGQAVSFHLLCENIERNKDCMFFPGSAKFLFVPWLLSIETFIVLILVWNDFFMVISLFTWTPSLLDAAILFSLFASEVGMAKTIAEPKSWLLFLILFLIFALVAFSYTYFQSKRREENRILFDMARKRVTLSMKMIASLIASLLIIIALSHFFPHLYWAGIFLSVATIISFIWSATKHWKEVKLFSEGKI